MEVIIGSISLEHPSASKIAYDDIKEAFLAQEWNSFHLLGKKLDDLQLNDFLKYKCELYFKQSLAPTQCKIIAAYRTSNHRLANEIGRWSTIPIFRDTSLCHFCSYNVVENEAHFVLECPLYKLIRVNFSTLFDNVVLGSLKYFIQLDHQVDINLYLMEAIALCHSRELVGLKPLWCTCSPFSLLGFLDFSSHVFGLTRFYCFKLFPPFKPYGLFIFSCIHTI